MASLTLEELREVAGMVAEMDDPDNAEDYLNIADEANAYIVDRLAPNGLKVGGMTAEDKAKARADKRTGEQKAAEVGCEQFRSERFEIGLGYSASLKITHGQYRAWCDSRGIASLGKNLYGDWLRGQGYRELSGSNVGFCGFIVKHDPSLDPDVAPAPIGKIVDRNYKRIGEIAKFVHHTIPEIRTVIATGKIRSQPCGKTRKKYYCPDVVEYLKDHPIVRPGLPMYGNPDEYLAERTEKVPGFRMITQVLHSDYCEWCRRIDREPFKIQKFVNFVRNHYPMGKPDNRRPTLYQVGFKKNLPW